MNDLGETWDNTDMPMEASNKEDPKKHYPCMDFTEDQMPGLKDAGINDEVTVTMKAVVKGIRLNSKKVASYELEFHEGDAEVSAERTSPTEKKGKLADMGPSKKTMDMANGKDSEDY